jgi:hypothetical protein
VPSHLMDSDAFDFANVRATGVPVPEGDHAFDTDAPIQPTAEPPVEDAQPLHWLARRPS